MIIWLNDMDSNELKRRTKDFAHRCVKLCMALSEDCLCHHIRKQLIRSSTSVVCNYRAVCIAQSKADFVSKLSIVIEETEVKNLLLKTDFFYNYQLSIINNHLLWLIQY